MREDELFAECAANPGDDAPRLVWADHVGGERGELVVAQCDLARGDLAIEDARARRIRERELLERHAVAWAGDLVAVADRWSFRRGFIESVKVSAFRLDAAALRTRAPLVGAVVITDVVGGGVDRGHLAALNGIRGLGLIGGYLGPEFAQLAPAIAKLGLHGLWLDGLGDSCRDEALAIVEQSPIEQLRFGNLRLGPDQFARLLTAAPRLTALELEPTPLSPTAGAPPSVRGPLIDLAVRRPLHALRLGHVTDGELARLGGSLAAMSLTRLGYELLGDQHAPPLLPNLHTIEVGGNAQAAARALVPERLPALRSIRLLREVQPEVVRELGARFGGRLDRLDVADPDLLSSRSGGELLHESPAALLTLGAPWFAQTQPIWMVHLNRGDVFAVRPVPVDEPVVIGRQAAAMIPIHDGSVARRHARLVWRKEGFEIQDMSSTNGVIIHGARVQRQLLVDGDELWLGEARLRYFVGPGGKERAERAVG